MNVTQTIDEKSFEEKRSVRAILGDFLGEGLVGVITVILAIIGLSGFSPEVMTSIATIIIGVAFLLEAGAVSMRFPAFLAEKRKEVLEESLSVGDAAEFIGGIAGILLGVLSLVGLSPIVLVSIGVIVYGFTLVFSSGAAMRFNLLLADETTQREHRNIAREAVSTAAHFEFLFGLSVAVLGIIALAGSMIAVTLNLAALLILGVSGFLTAAVVTAKMGRVAKS
jgi:hypothetical protein